MWFARLCGNVVKNVSVEMILSASLHVTLGSSGLLACVGVLSRM